MTNQCKGCIHRPICEWYHENSAFKFPEREGGCDLYHPEEKSRPSKEDIKMYWIMKIKAVIALIVYAAAMLITPVTVRMVFGIQEVWVVSWIFCLIGWWCMTGSHNALMQVLNEKIKEWEEEYGKEGNKGS